MMRDLGLSSWRDQEGRIDWKKQGPVVLAVIAVAVFLYLRLRNLNLALTWDEARFMLNTNSFVTGLNDEWSVFTNMHPPVYLWICAFLSKVFGGGAVSFKLVSVLFSLGTLLLVGRMAGFLFDRWTGALSMFFLAVLPAATVLDTWIKQDSVAVFFLTLTIYLFLREKYVFSGIALGVGMLSKETAIFALPAIGLYALSCWRREKILGVLEVGLIGAALSFWWYLFVSDYVGHFGSFFLGNNYESEYFTRSWHYYVSGARYDLGWCILLAAAAGLVFCFWRRFRGSLVHMLPVAWLLPVYVFLSLSTGKPYWMITPALPAAAMLAALGATGSARWLGRRMPSARSANAARIILVGSLLAWALLGAVFTSGWEYNLSRGDFQKEAEMARQDADLILGNLGEGDTILIVYRMDPTLVYYLEDTDLVARPIWMLSSPEDLASYARAIDAEWVYVGKNLPTDEDLDDLLLRIKELLPVKAAYPGAYYSYLLEVD